MFQRVKGFLNDTGIGKVLLGITRIIVEKHKVGEEFVEKISTSGKGMREGNRGECEQNTPDMVCSPKMRSPWLCSPCL